MTRGFFVPMVAWLFLSSGVAWAAVDFGQEVLPVLQRACFECHGREQQKGGLQLDEKSSFNLGGKNGPVVKAGHPDESELVRRISLPRTDKQAMPKRGTPLNATEIAAIRQWVAAGAVWPDQVVARKHWSYVKPERPALPSTQDQAWAENGLDRFILARLEKEGLRPSGPAAPAVLLRRLSLDLTGLPPSVAEVEAFERAWAAAGDKVDGVIEAAVDRLLASQEFGVRWARPWLDLARYADSHGFQRDDLREIWGYRDWVVKALNAGMPFDQFTIEQVAGDLLPNATADQIVATGFHRCTPTNVEAGTEPEESRINQVIDRVNTTGAVWLGSTLECAQCHNHKYDPFTQRDYYSLLAYFNNTVKEAERTNPNTPGSIRFDGVPFTMPNPEAEPERQRLQAALDAVAAKMTARRKAIAKEGGGTAGAAAMDKSGTLALHVSAFDSESGAEQELLPDGSLLLATGDVPDVDVYTIEAELPAGPFSGIRLDALTHESLPGSGPGRGSPDRPNFVLQELHAALSAPGKGTPATPVKFADAYASFSQSNFPVTGLLEEPQTGWAINPRFGEDHWCVLAFDKPMTVAGGTKLTLRLVQKFGGGRVMGRFKLSAITGEVAAALPEVDKEPQPVAARKRGKGKAAAVAPKTRDPELAKLEREQTSLQRQLNALKPGTSEVMRELAEPRMTAIFKRGVYTDPADPVVAATPTLFESRAKGPPNRLTLARWLVSRDNPLTARVTVNRWWAELFGQGIVATVEDFGIKGAPPTHPELLDWLAVEFMDSGWSMKALLKTLVMSATYRQASGLPPALGRDAAEYARRSALYAQGSRFRLDAEGIRDNALAIGGLISLKKGGPPIRPPQPDGLWAKVGGQQYKYEVSPGEEKHRRGLYVVLKRGAPYPSFVNFDASARMACVVKRSRSNTPLQALTLLNDPVYVEAAKAFAGRIVRESPSSDLDARLTRAFRIALARQPTPGEIHVLKELWEGQFESAKADAKAAKSLAEGFARPDGLSNAEFAAWYAVASALLNLAMPKAHVRE